MTRKIYTVVDGKVVPKEAPSRPRNKSPLDLARKSLHFTSHQLPTWHPAAPRVDWQGRPQFQSYKEIQEFEAKSRDMGEDWNYNEA